MPCLSSAYQPVSGLKVNTLPYASREQRTKNCPHNSNARYDCRLLHSTSSRDANVINSGDLCKCLPRRSFRTQSSVTSYPRPKCRCDLHHYLHCIFHRDFGFAPSKTSTSRLLSTTFHGAIKIRANVASEVPLAKVASGRGSKERPSGEVIYGSHSGSLHFCYFSSD